MWGLPGLAERRSGKGARSERRNDIMMCQLIQAKSADEAAKMFVGHPHFCCGSSLPGDPDQ